MKLFMLRHAHSMGNEKHILDSSSSKFDFGLSKKGKIVSREEIAKTIWEQSWEDFYSDWAIDQTISRLRKKLSELDVLPQIIKTIRGRGFCCLID